jgi:hypothetical protein
MNDDIRRGLNIVFFVIVAVALLEVTLDVVLFYQGKLRASHGVRVCLTYILLEKLWKGATWARWLWIILFSIGSIGLFIIGIIAVGKSLLGWSFVFSVVGSIYLACGIGLLRPCVAIFQADQREKNRS